MQDRKKLPALDKSLKVKNPDLPDIYNRNYTDKILKYAGLATQFPQLETNAKTIVDAINELYSGGGGDGKHRTLTQAEYDDLTEEEKNDGTIYFITDAPSVFIRPEDLEAGDALDGQLLTFYKNSSNIGVWTATPMIRDLHNGDAIMWSSEYGTWVNGTISSGKSNLSELNDVNLSDLQSGQILKYDGTDWVNTTEGDLSNYYTKSETNTLLDAKADVSDLPDMTDYYTKLATDTLLAEKADISDVPEDIQDLDNVSISSASNGQVLTYNNGNWVNANASGGASSLDELSDVDITSAQSGQVLKYDGTDWVNAAESTGSTVTVTQIQSTGTKIAIIGVDGVNTDLYSPNGGGSPSALDDLTDVTINTPTNGQVLTYDNGDWVNSNASGGASALDDLTDVSITSVTDGQVLTYDSNSDEWINDTISVTVDAEDVDYDNTTSGLTADDVQEAIDEVVDNLDDKAEYVELTQLEYDALSPAEKNNGTLYFITDANGNGSQFQPIIYSEAEREIGVWVDGKPLYEKTVYNAGGTSGYINIAHNISNLSVCVDAFGTCHDVGYGVPLTGVCDMPITRIGGDNNDIGICGVDTTNVIFSVPSAFQQRIVDIYITIRYTKSTDTAGSGIWTPQGVPTHHYSTDEQIIGTWIDGSTLYEKTLSINPSDITGNETTIQHGIANLATCVRAEGYLIRNNTLSFPIPSYHSDSAWGTSVYDITSTTICLYIGSRQRSANITDIFITLQYTKSSS